MPNATQLWIPDEVWLEILENHIPIAHAPGSLEQWQSISSLSLTCRRLRRITLPAVYHSLTFDLNPEEPEQGGLRAMRSVLRAEFRANCLAQCPHLLQHVREFTLASWDPKILGPPAPGERSAADKLSSKTRGDWWWAAYDVVTGLVLQMPGLRKLCVLGSAITLRLHLSVNHHRGLESLVLSSDNGYQYCDASLEISKPPMILFPVEVPPPTIRHLDLIGRDEWDEFIGYPDYFTTIVSYNLLDIISLKIYFPHIPCELSAITCLSCLRSLTVELASPYDNYNYSALRGLLESSPALHSLEFFSGYEWTTDVGLQDLRVDALPTLEVVSGPPGIVMPLIFGRPVNTIRLKVHAAEALESLDILASSTAQVHTFEPNAVVCSEDEMLMVLQFSGRFVNLTHLKITYDYRTRKGIDSWGEGPRDADFVNMVVENISQLPRLLVCWVFDPDYLFTDQGDLSADEEVPLIGEVHDLEDVDECPIGDARNPVARGHPSLKEILLFHPPIWRWYPGEGWTPQILPPHILDL